MREDVGVVTWVVLCIRESLAGLMWVEVCTFFGGMQLVYALDLGSDVHHVEDVVASGGCVVGDMHPERVSQRHMCDTCVFSNVGLTIMRYIPDRIVAAFHSSSCPQSGVRTL